MTHLPRASARAAALLAGAMLCVVVTPGAALADDSAEPTTTTESTPESAPEATPESAPEPTPESAPEPAAAPAEPRAEAPVTALAAPDPADPCFPDACISNGTVRLGVTDEGSLIVGAGNVFGGNDQDGTGLQQVSTGNDGLRAGGPYEGWGVGDAGTGVEGQSLKSFEDTRNLTVESFDVTPTTATSVVTIGDPEEPTFRVTHAFTPSLLDPNVYVIRVRIENLTDGTLDDVRYRRVMDWDVEPTEFQELVSVVDRDVAVVGAGTEFVGANVLGSDFGAAQGDVDDRGPDDLTAHFDLSLGSLAAGDFIEFFLFYGVAPTEADALDSLATVGADSYSTARPSSSADGSPGTFFFGYNPLPEGIEAPVDPTDPTDPSDPDGDGGSGADGGSADVKPVSASVPLAAGAQLPATGADAMGPFVIGGVALLAGGMVMVGLGRRRRVEQA